MNKVDIFDFNFFNKNKIKSKRMFFDSNLDIFLAIASFSYGAFAFYSSLSYLHDDIMLFILGALCSMLFLIYSPIMHYIIRQFYTRLIIFSYKNSSNELCVFLRNKQRIKISHYEIIDDWKPYFLTFYLFIHKLDYYEHHWLLVEKNTKYYTIKDLDTGILYLYCVNKEQYLNALEQETEKSIDT